MQIKSQKGGMASIERRVHPKAIRNHGFLGLPFVRQHMMIDEKWTTTDIRDLYKSMAGCLDKHYRLKCIEKKHKTQNLQREYTNLRNQCREGRQILQGIQKTHNRQIIRNLLQENKGKQCLYQDMTTPEIIENLDQGTFVLRKERDRLTHRKSNLENTIKELKLKAAALEDRIKYHNIFELDEEKLSRDYEKKLVNSQIRLKAVKAINSAYKKILKILHHDEMFYEPILQSLSGDINDQRMFIEHILDLGRPAIEEFERLKGYFKQYDDKVKWESQTLIQEIANAAKLLNKKPTPVRPSKEDEFQLLISARERYTRTTYSMAKMNIELEKISDVIKQMQVAMLCSKATHLFPRIKGQIDNNYKLKKEIVCDSLGLAALETKGKFSDVLLGVIKNNLSQAEVERLDRITSLNDQIKKEELFEKSTIDAMKQSNNILVVLRVFLWNIYDILSHVHKSPRMKKIQYPNSYLKLPLLKFEMSNTYSSPPDTIADDNKELYRIIHRKLSRLITAYDQLTITGGKPHTISKNLNLEAYRDLYMNEYIAMMHDHQETNDVEIGDVKPKGLSSDADDDYDVEMRQGNYDTRNNLRPMGIYNREQMKAKSLRLVEEELRKD
ncbi:uncharacterized protein LOC142220740 [Haematobia irritans]|uniref:uncharacterized protein LOC142220740 n=1 Tax=Haematobia irritans TaxID=7368 RepID=UPI003F4FDC33